MAAGEDDAVFRGASFVGPERTNGIEGGEETAAELEDGIFVVDRGLSSLPCPLVPWFSPFVLALPTFPFAFVFDWRFALPQAPPLAFPLPPAALTPAPALLLPIPRPLLFPLPLRVPLARLAPFVPPLARPPRAVDCPFFPMRPLEEPDRPRAPLFLEAFLLCLEDTFAIFLEGLAIFCECERVV